YDLESSYARAGGSFDLLVDAAGVVVGTVGRGPLRAAQDVPGAGAPWPRAGQAAAPARPGPGPATGIPAGGVGDGGCAAGGHRAVRVVRLPAVRPRPPVGRPRSCRPGVLPRTEQPTGLFGLLALNHAQAAPWV